jgi:DNA-binding transcriptional LysR family regulator
MQWDDLEVFVCVAELGSFTRAAEQLGRPKSAISRGVTSIEKRLGERLLELNNILNERQLQNTEVRGVLNIATTYEIATANLIDVLPEMLSAHPELKVNVDLRHQIADPVEAGYDLILYQSQMPLPDSGVIARRLYDVAFGIYAAPSLVRERGFPQSLIELQSWPAITGMPNQVYRLFREETGETFNFQSSSRLTIPSALVRTRSAEMGVGFAVLPLMFCRELIEKRRLVRLLPDHEPAPLTIYALLPSRKIIPARVSALLDAISRRFDALTPLR